MSVSASHDPNYFVAYHLMDSIEPIDMISMSLTCKLHLNAFGYYVNDEMFKRAIVKTFGPSSVLINYRKMYMRMYGLGGIPCLNKVKLFFRPGSQDACTFATNFRSPLVSAFVEDIVRGIVDNRGPECLHKLLPEVLVAQNMKLEDLDVEGLVDYAMDHTKKEHAETLLLVLSTFSHLDQCASTPT